MELQLCNATMATGGIAFDLILPGLAIGNAEAANDLSFLRANSVTHILNVTRTPNANEAYWRRKRRLLQIPVDDSRDERISQHFAAVSRLL